VIRHGQVLNPVATKIGHSNGLRVLPYGEVHWQIKGTVSMSQQNGHAVIAGVGDRQINNIGCMEMPYRDKKGILTHDHGFREMEAPIAVAEEDGHAVGAGIGDGQILNPTPTEVTSGD
jgi:hypothetical protein